ncbi:MULTISPECIES: WbqC family protein [Lysinibacillus]|uniref:WbqC family protein n=1 Tax=Lysinibacillus TaxID=400634 RepID=UPI0021A85C1C|nr:WbqC family protein [Lysinibacillus capsici]MCT1539291.1 WbqC family protein [Lysinibacillus capsici]MCT1570641.1 WbqC family protein [Lysinibacillus capsici]MCT1647451.1 WbqC family protein [Lysinibacillus capsici]MCT1726271.1 WbqC family protein [Lysinibacillus capsici]MCT1783375.1 WbqC family protein [Lysinibacillus capsici]
MTKVAIIQSNYIPWKGYFDIINDSDIFIFLDDVQYTTRDWRNRNKIKTPQGLKWLSIPVGNDTKRLICDVVIEDPSWSHNHWQTIKFFYGKSPYFSLYEDFFKEIYCSKNWTKLSKLNQYLIENISTEILGIKNTKFISSEELKSQGRKDEKLVSLLKSVQGNTYISGPAAMDYINNNLFETNNIKLIYKDYSNYPEYEQFHPPFEHGVSILDLIFQKGPDAPYYIWGWREV